MKAARASPDGATLSRRRRRALVSLGLILATLVLSGVVAQSADSGVLQEAANATTWEMPPTGVFDELARATTGEGEGTIPKGFEEEVFSLEGLSEVRVDVRRAVVGFTLAKSATEAFADFAEELEDRGWMAVESGMNTCGSFVKSGGSYRWVFISCVPVGKTTSVVVQGASEDEGKQ